MVPISYEDGKLHFPSLSILLPPLGIKSYDAATGRLVLSLTDSQPAAVKLSVIQEFLLGIVAQSYRGWFGGRGGTQPSRTAAEIRSGFQPLLEGLNLNLYCPAGQGTSPQYDLQIYKEGEGWLQNAAAATLRPGAQVQVAFRLQGISFHLLSSGTWSGKFRFQHRIITIHSKPSGP